jgi:hypothetical protein
MRNDYILKGKRNRLNEAGVSLSLKATERSRRHEDLAIYRYYTEKLLSGRDAEDVFDDCTARFGISDRRMNRIVYGFANTMQPIVQTQVDAKIYIGLDRLFGAVEEAVAEIDLNLRELEEKEAQGIEETKLRIKRRVYVDRPMDRYMPDQAKKGERPIKSPLTPNDYEETELMPIADARIALLEKKLSYRKQPLEALKALRADVIINMGNRAFENYTSEELRKMLADAETKHGRTEVTSEGLESDTPDSLNRDDLTGGNGGGDGMVVAP